MASKQITADTLIAECVTLADAKEVSREMRKTLIVIANKYGENAYETKGWRERYDNFVDAMCEKAIAKGFTA